MTTFPEARKRGYNVREVETFLNEARRAFDTDADDAPGEAGVTMTAADIRHTSFGMKRHGYSPEHVDAALERLEDAFAARERERGVFERGKDGWLADARESAKEIVARLERPDKRRFSRTGFLSVGYRKTDVDRLCRRLLRYFHEGKSMSVEDIRTAVFRRQRGGYRETQVDLLIDAVTEVMLAVR